MSRDSWDLGDLFHPVLLIQNSVWACSSFRTLWLPTWDCSTRWVRNDGGRLHQQREALYCSDDRAVRQEIIWAKPRQWLISSVQLSDIAWLSIPEYTACAHFLKRTAEAKTKHRKPNSVIKENGLIKEKPKWQSTWRWQQRRGRYNHWPSSSKSKPIRGWHGQRKVDEFELFGRDWSHHRSWNSEYHRVHSWTWSDWHKIYGYAPQDRLQALALRPRCPELTLEQYSLDLLRPDLLHAEGRCWRL